MSGFAGLVDQLQQALRAGGKGLVSADFWDDVVVVGVEPLGHFQRRGISITAGKGEFFVQADVFGVAAESTDGQSGFQYLVVIRDVSWDGVIVVKTQIFQAGISIYAQRVCGGFEGGAVDAASPVRLKSALELAVSTNARIALDGFGWEWCLRHVCRVLPQDK